MKTFLAACLLFASGISIGATTAKDVLNECSEGNDHPRVTSCVVLRAKTSATELARVESDLRNAIAALPKDALNLKAARTNFETSSRVFKIYRASQCKAQSEFAAVSMYAAEIGLACEAELNSKRIDELNAGIRWLK
jgi:hypothetical protein